MNYEMFRDTLIWTINLNEEGVHDNSSEMPTCFQKIDERLEMILIRLGDLLNPSNSDGDGPEPYMEHTYNIISSIMQTCKKREVTVLSIVVEDAYVDRVYRDAYYMHYSGKHFDTDRRAIRVFFFMGDIKEQIANKKASGRRALERTLQHLFYGYLVLTSVHGCTVSRSLLSPFLFVDCSEKATIRVCNYTCCVFGLYFNVKAFPYMQQDGETISCAEVTVLLLTDYYSKKYQDYRFVLPSNIVRIGDSYTPQRMTPSIGMKYEGLSHVLKDIGFEPLLIEACSSFVNIRFLIHSYVDSNIPIAIHIQDKISLSSEHHSVVCVGYDRKRNTDKRIVQNFTISAGTRPVRGIYMIESSQLYQSYYIMDDNEIPYKKAQLSTKRIRTGQGITESKSVSNLSYSGVERDIVSIILPLNKRMAMRADDAYIIFTQFLSGPCGITNYLRIKDFKVDERLLGESSENPLVLRIFMTTGRSLKHHRCLSFNPDLAQLYATIPMPRFVWVCEISSKESYEDGKVLGEIVIDATSSKFDKDGSIILCLYPDILACRLPNQPYYPLIWKDIFQQGVKTDMVTPFSAYYSGESYIQPQREQNGAASEEEERRI